MQHGISTLFLQTCIILVSCHTPTQPGMDCTNYRKGKFYYHFAIDNISSTYYINRTDSTQQEINDETHDTTTLRIKWLNECTYELRFLKSTETLPPSADQVRRNFVAQTTIESSSDDYYLSHTTNNIGDEIRKDTIWLDRRLKPVRLH